MPLLAETRAFLIYLRQHKDVQKRIKASRDKTLLYAGEVFAPAWKEIKAFQRRQPGAVEILHDILEKLPAPPPHRGTLQSYAEDLARKEKATNGDQNERIIWRTLSGIFASNAEGKVWFYTGSNVSHDTKVFALTEIWVLRRNPHISPESKEMLEYFVRCVRDKNSDMNAGYLPGP